MHRPLAILLTAATFAAAPAFAASGTFQMEIDFSRARLDAPQTVRAEYVAIREQVEDRCMAEHATVKIGHEFAVRSCTRRTLGVAIRKIDHAGLTALHASSR